MHGLSGGPRIAIIGAGIGGLSFAIALKRQFAFENFTIYEKGSDIGGTWRGCGSDVSVHFYSLSTDLNPMWDRLRASQPEIQLYWKGLTKKYSLQPHIVFNTLVLSVEWDITAQLYHIKVRDVSTGVTASTTAQIVISAIGILEVPRYPPNLAGISAFKGESFHCARWNHGVDLRGKRVAVIGNGASAIQFIPNISQDPSVQVTNFCRTPSWFVSTNTAPYSAKTKWLFAHVPFLMRTYRNLLYIKTEMAYMIFCSEWVRNLTRGVSAKYILNTAPSEYHNKLIPDYPMGCKRILYDPGYLNSLHRPNVSLNWDGISEITKNGIRTAKGEMPFDVVIYATGFTTDEYPIPIRGIEGQTLEDYFTSKGGPQAYIGTTVPGFPNFYMLSGPNTATGHTSVIFTEEVQINYALQLIKPVLNGSVSSFEVTAKAADAYNEKLQARLARSVFMQCNSWYRVGGEGKIVAAFPWPAALFWWWLRRPVWDHYKAVGANRWPRPRRSMGTAQMLGVLLLSGALLLKSPMSVSALWDCVRSIIYSIAQEVPRRKFTLGRLPAV